MIVKGNFPENLITRFGLRVRELRKQKEMTMEALALKSGLSYRQISRIELGKVNPSLTTIYQVAHGLEIDVSSLLKVPAY